MLNELLPGEGDSYCLGELNGDHWYLYMLDNEAADKPLELRQDRTTEIFMKALDESIMRLFFIETYACRGAHAGAVIDAAFPSSSPIAERIHTALSSMFFF